jgi:tetratricopeptide (TPR) repeat protein
LERSESTKNIRYWRKIEPQFFISKTLRKRNRASLPDLLNFNEYQQERDYDEQKIYGLDKDDNPIREWVRGIWNKWFDEVFPLSESEKKFRNDLLKSRSKKTSTEGEKPNKYNNNNKKDVDDDNDDDFNDNESISIKSEEIKNENKVNNNEKSDAFKKALHSAHIYEKYDKVEITNKSKLDSKLIKDIESEINELNKRIEIRFNTFDLCRRGCLFRKLGMLKLALNDLTQVIELESNYIDAYWNRHLIYLAQNKKDLALNDLNTILKLKKSHAGAYLSRGDLCADKFETSMAIVNYSQAIKYESNNYLAYYKRAQMYETNGDILMAMDDYSTTTKLNPKISEAWFKHGMNYFNKK